MAMLLLVILVRSCCTVVSVLVSKLYFCIFIIRCNYLKYYLETYKQAKSFAEKKKSLRCNIPIDYCEKDFKIPKQNRPQSACAQIKKKVEIKIERISNLKKALYIRNQESDMIRLDELDVDEMDDLLDESDDEMPPDISVTNTDPSSLANADETADDVIEINATARIVTPECLITTGIDPIEVDEEFSLEYCFVNDVSYFHVSNS